MTINNKISDVLITVGKNVKEIRKEKKLTQQELAFNCGNMDKATISNIERFACDGINISTLIKISNVLEIDIIELFVK